MANSKVTSLNYFGDVINWDRKNFGYLVFEIKNAEFDSAYYIRNYKYNETDTSFDELYFVDFTDTPTAFTGTVPDEYVG